jgi:pimeloyl-ACP methyl ester carboxylesterase
MTAALAGTTLGQSAGGVPLNVVEAGDPSWPAILFIQGLLGDTRDWDGWVDRLSRHYRVIRLDLPGFGLSEIANGNYSIDRSDSLIDGLMGLLGIERFAKCA